MGKITKLDRNALKALRDPIEKELAELGERLGLKFRVGRGTFGEGAEASYKLEIEVDDPETKLAAAKVIWDRNCAMIGYNFDEPDQSGLRPEDFGTEFPYGDGTYRTTGIATSGRGSQKFPILVEIVKPGSRQGGKVGEVRMLPEAAVPRIRAATDAKAKAGASA